MKPVVAVRTQYTRSVNLERDFDTDVIIRSYIPTTRAVATLKRLADTLRDGNMPRAWSLVGPYGSGKSSFAVFLAALLSRPEKGLSAIAATTLKTHDKALAVHFQDHVRHSAGYCRVLLTGAPEPLAPRIVRALHSAAVELWSAKRGKNPVVLAKLEALAQEATPTGGAVVEVTRELLNALERIDSRGIVLVIDELGKFLEYEARHYGANDIYLLQSLAELAYKGDGPKLHCLVLLHQSFEQYAQGLDETLRNEWYKVQGRFETVPFVEAAEQVLRVVAAALDSSGLPKDAAQGVRRYSEKVAKTLAGTSALPSGLTESRAAALFAACYPLHPLAALILPALCQKVAQNERTLFSYLGSQEPFGFRDSVARLHDIGEWVLPWQIYEYFVLNQPRIVSDPITQRRWAEVVTALDRLGDTNNDEACVLKVIGLLNIIGAHAGLKASKDIVSLAHTLAATVERATESLIQKSIVQYRKFSGEYRVWQGSDFDLDLAMQSELATLGKFSLSQHLNERSALQPIIVRGHSIRTATLRYFLPIFVDASLWCSLHKDSDHPRLILFLAEGQHDLAFFMKEVINSAADSDVVALVPNGAQLRAIVAEILCLERIHRTTETLNSDPVAAREFKDRWDAASLAEHSGVGGLLDHPEQKRWFWRRTELKVKTKRSLQEELSRVFDRVYSGAPIFRNELINCDSPSSTAHAARNKLLFALLNRAATADLGFDKFPAERSMYRALFSATGLHQQTDNGWALCPPGGTSDPYNLQPMWAEIDQFLEATELGRLPFSELERRLTRVPYGVKKGVLPLIYALTLLINKDELAIYEDDLYTSTVTDELLERLARRPHTFSVQRFRLKGLRAALLDEYAAVLFTEQKQSLTLLKIAQPLVQFIAALPDYAKRTKSVSPMAQNIRSAILYSKSPAALVFRDLPIACGYPDFSGLATDELAAKGFADILIIGLRELQGAYVELSQDMKSLFASALGADLSVNLRDLRRLVGGRYAGLERYSMDADGLSAFVRRLTSLEGDDDTWFERMLLFLGHKPSTKWDDRDRSTAEFRLAEFARRMNDLEKLRVHHEGQRRRRGDGFTVRLVRVVKQGDAEHEQLLVSDSEQESAVQAASASLLAVIADLASDELRIAALGEAIARIAALATERKALTDESNKLENEEIQNV
jgi:hypothetical protein